MEGGKEQPPTPPQAWAASVQILPPKEVELPHHHHHKA
jgi:hypothetical protein